MRKSTRGFTIVELLIVVVVIAILAVISTVAYTNFQQRARNTQTVSAVSTYIKALNLYKIDNGQHPTVVPAGSCLGTGYDSLECDSANSYNVNQSNLNMVLAPYFGSSAPMPSNVLGEITAGRQFGGAVYVWNTSIYGGSQNGGIGLYHQGAGSCPVIGGITLRSTDSYIDGSGSWCRYAME